MAVVGGMFPRWFINKKTGIDKIFRNIKELDEAGPDWITKDEYFGISEVVTVKREEIIKPQEQPINTPIVPIKIIKPPPTIEVPLGHPRRAKMTIRPREDKNEKFEKSDPENPDTKETEFFK